MKYVSLLLLVLSVSATALAQDLDAGKHLAFAQIAFGGGYETLLNMSNRGTAAFNGTLTLLPSDRTKPFPALVDGSPASAALNLALNPGATASLRITSGDASAGTLSGFAIIAATNPERASLLEGNLTYYVKSADGTIVDSVGVAPSRPILQAVIPFDDFQTVALALANRNSANQTATVRLMLFDDKNAQIGRATQTLANNEQVPRFLYQFFPGVSLTKGRVEIQADQPFLGTALTFVKGGQASSLPFLPSLKLYDVRLEAAGQTFTGQAYIAVDFPYVTGYFVETVNGVPQPGTESQIGILKDGRLELFDVEGSNELFHARIPAFNLTQQTHSGTAEFIVINPPSVTQATLTLTAVN